MTSELIKPESGDLIVPLHETTWNLDLDEGNYINHLKETHTEALAEP